MPKRKPSAIYIAPSEAGEKIAAAKLHVLHLQPIKDRLGDKWDRLSDLVHKLFEKALAHAQAPGDHFMRVDELCYVATFHGQTLEEAGLACTAIAKQVCEQLFGHEVAEVTIRNLVGLVPASSFAESTDGSDIAAMLESVGRETTMTHPPRPKKSPAGSAALRDDAWRFKERAPQAERKFDFGYYPIWDLQKGKSSSLFLKPAVDGADQRGGLRGLMVGSDEHRILETEKMMLAAAADYAARIAAAGKVCAVGVGVSYETLSKFRSRMGYIGIARRLYVHPSCPVFLKIEQVPDGIPVGRLAEINAMLSVVLNMRTLIEFQNARALPEFDIRLGISGIGTVLPVGCDADQAALTAQLLSRRAARQRMFVFLGGLATRQLVDMAQENNVRLGTGDALDRHYLTGAEDLPDFPLAPAGEQYPL